MTWFYLSTVTTDHRSSSLRAGPCLKLSVIAYKFAPSHELGSCDQRGLATHIISQSKMDRFHICARMIPKMQVKRTFALKLHAVFIAEGHLQASNGPEGTSKRKYFDLDSSLI